MFVITLLSAWFATDTPDSPVKLEPSPENDVAVHTPVKNASPSGLIVIPVPTFKFSLIVVMPVANISPSLLKVIPLPTTMPF